MRRRPSGVEIFKADSYPRSTLRAISARNLINVSAERSATGVAVVQVCGEVDMHTAPILRAELEDQLDPPPTVLVLDLTGVAFLAASGIRVLLEARERAAMTGTPLRLVYATRGVRRVLDVLNLNHLFPPYATLADALASGCEPPRLCAKAAGVPDIRAGRPAR